MGKKDYYGSHTDEELARLPTVYRGPYEYSVPGRDEDYWPQNVPS